MTSPSAPPPAPALVDRRRSLASAGALAVLAASAGARAASPSGRPAMTIACFIRYEIDPYQRDAFRTYAQTWGRVIPRCGGHLIGYFLPHEGTNYVGWGLIAFESLAAYETYRARIKADPEGRDNFRFAQSGKFILREERTFLEVAEGTFEIPAGGS